MTKKRKSIRSGLLSGIIIGTLVSGWMWYVVDDREKENLLAQQSPIYKAQLALQKFREATVEEDSMGQLFHLQKAISALGDAYTQSPEEPRRLLQQQNTILQLARLRAQMHQDDEARKLRKDVLDKGLSLRELDPSDEPIRELSLAAFLDWAKTPGTPTSEVVEVGKRLGDSLISSFKIVSPLEQTRLATSDLQFIVLQRMQKDASLKAQLELIDVALRSLMDGIDATTQPLLYAIQVQKFINEAKRVAETSKSHQLKAHFAALNLDWRRRRALLEPLDMMAKVLLAEAILAHISLSPDFDANALKEVQTLIEKVQTTTKSDKEMRRLFFAHSNLGAYLSKRKKISQALQTYQSALKIAETFKVTHPDSLVTALSNLGFLTKRAQDTKGAQALFDQAFEQAKRLIEVQPDARILWLKAYYRALSFGTLGRQKKNLKSLRISARGYVQKLEPNERVSVESILKKLKRKSYL